MEPDEEGQDGYGTIGMIAPKETFTTSGSGYGAGIYGD